MCYKKWSFHVYSDGWRHFLVCISSASERKEKWNCIHLLVILSLKTLWAGVKHWRTAPHRFYVYRKPISSPRSRNLKVIKKMCTFEVHLYMSLDNWFCQLCLLLRLVTSITVTMVITIPATVLVIVPDQDFQSTACTIITRTDSLGMFFIQIWYNDRDWYKF